MGYAPGVPTSRKAGISLIEMLLAFTILVVCLVPLIELMTGTTRGTKITRDYLIAYNLAQMVFEHVMHEATANATDAFDQVVARMQKTTKSSIADLALAPRQLFPDDGLPEFNPQTGDQNFVDLFKRYKYTCAIVLAPASADTVLSAADSKTQLARVDIKVFWFDHQNKETNLSFSDYIVRRRF